MNNRISELIKFLHLSKADFAKKLNVSAPFVSQLCSGTSQPSDRTISDICREFNVNEAWLRTGEGEMFLKLSRNDEIAAYVAGIMKNEDAELQRFIVQLMSRIPPDCWSIIEQKARELADEKKKNQD